MLNRKLLLSLLTIGMLATVACGGTWAYFSDSASTADNVVEAGTISLVITNGIATGATHDITFAADNAQPGDTDIPVKSLRVENDGSIDGRLTATAANARDSYGIGRYLVIKLNGQTIYDHGTPVEGVIAMNLASQHHITPVITYTFENTGTQQNVQGDKFIFDIVFTLKQGLAP